MTDTTDAVDPCWFCDSSRHCVAKSPVSGEYRVSCTNCWAAGPPGADEAKAITAWNTRATPTAVSGEVERLREAVVDLNNAACMVLVGLNQRIKEADPQAAPVFYGIAELNAAIKCADAALSPVDTDNGGEAIPAGMKPWHGNDRAPADWDGGPVLWFDGKTCGAHPQAAGWRNPAQGIRAYTPKPASDNIGGAVECASSPLPSGKHQVDTSMESGPNHCFFCEQPMPASPSPQGKPSLDGESGK